MHFSAALIKLAFAIGMVGMAAHGSTIPVEAKIKARVEARLAKLKGSELVGRKDWCTPCLSCSSPDCNACCCCYGGCDEGFYDCSAA